MAIDIVDSFYNRPAGFRENLQYSATFALVHSRDHLHIIIFFYLHTTYATPPKRCWGKVTPPKIYLNHFGRQRDDFHKIFLAKLSGYSTKNSCSFGVVVIVQNDHSIAVKTDI